MSVLMCPNCLELLDVYTEVGIRHENEFPLHLSMCNVEYDCPDCQSHVLGIQLDKEIADTVSFLNKKGYKTLWSCWGHDNENEKEAYIVFEESFENFIRAYPFIREYFVSDDEKGMHYKYQKFIANNNRWVKRFVIYYDGDDEKEKKRIFKELTDALPFLGKSSKFHENIYWNKKEES